jgi:uncharacterized membrane protein YfcA
VAVTVLKIGSLKCVVLSAVGLAHAQQAVTSSSAAVVVVEAAAVRGASVSVRIPTVAVLMVAEVLAPPSPVGTPLGKRLRGRADRKKNTRRIHMEVLVLVWTETRSGTSRAGAFALEVYSSANVRRKPSRSP